MNNIKKCQWLKKEIERYHAYLCCGEEISFDQRVSISKEVTRLSIHRQSIMELPMRKMEKDCNDYEIEIPSKINENY